MSDGSPPKNRASQRTQSSENEPVARHQAAAQECPHGRVALLNHSKGRPADAVRLLGAYTH